MTHTTSNIRFVSSEQRWARAKGVANRVMVFEPKGYYPRGTLHVPNGVFHADTEISFSIVKGESWSSLDPDAPFSEFDWASPQELRLISSLLLCERRDDAYIRFYPIVRYGHLLEEENIDLSRPSIVNDVKALLLKLARNSKPGLMQDRIVNCLEKPYDLVEPDHYGFDRLLSFWKALSPANYVVLRGIYALVKSDMLSFHYEFSEEAIVSLYIALDASFTLVLRKLREDGVINPSSHDAALWLHEHFDKPFGLPEPDITEKYFHEFYEQRVMTLHPASRYGDMPYSPIMHDDIPHLRRSLREIFAYIVLGTHGPDYEEEVIWHKKHSEYSTNA
ncbi:hypothetical protein [Thiohalophilus sp.]|uniref:hypothetical protein n=1 Tax=Thiohalophilus sp. TaxID=3028392 RepID=UPI002ACDF2EB|nr:hypothetical protein [Thiohalophilus sp.]MDZ7660936.1 hypothetical protein [Thiohalophilus sp.]